MKSGGNVACPRGFGPPAFGSGERAPLYVVMGSPFLSGTSPALSRRTSPTRPRRTPGRPRGRRPRTTRPGGEFPRWTTWGGRPGPTTLTSLGMARWSYAARSCQA